MANKDKVITIEECKIILYKYFTNSQYELIEYNIEPLSETTEGFLGEHFIVKCKTKYDNIIHNLSFFAKIPPLNFDMQMEFARGTYAFEKEIFFYEVFLKRFKNFYPAFKIDFLPNLYYSRTNELIVMENLQENNFSVASYKDYIDMKHLKLLIKTLTRLHSMSIIYEEGKSIELGKSYKLTDDYEKFLKDIFFREDESYIGSKWLKASQNALLGVIDKIPKLNEANFKQKFYKLTEECKNVVNPSKAFRNVLCHGDLWIKNALFRYENGYPIECKFVDFQLIKYNPPAFDVLKVIHQTTSSQMRKNHFEDLLEYYYDNLCEELILNNIDPSQTITKDEFLASVQYLLPHCKVETSYYYSCQKIGFDNVTEIMKNPEDYRKFIFLDRKSFMIKYCKEGSDFEKWMKEILLDIKDMVLNHGFTREDCYSIVRRKLGTTNYKLKNYYVSYINEKNGFMGDHIKLKITVKIGNEENVLNFFAKTIPGTVFSNFVVTSGAFNNEKFVYEYIFPKLNNLCIDIYNFVPKCYLARTNDLLVLDDLNEHGFKIVDKFTPLTFDEVATVVKTLAKIHGSSLILEEKRSLNGALFRIENNFNTHITEIDYVNIKGHLGLDGIIAGIRGLEAMVDLFPKKNVSITQKQFKNIINKLFETMMFDLIKPSKKYRNVLCHGDLWASNIMIKYQSEKPVESRIIDFQCVRICPPAHDLMIFLYSTTSREFRQKFMMDIKNIYYEELKVTLENHDCTIENIIPYEMFLESCDLYKIFAITHSATLLAAVMMSMDVQQKLKADEKFFYHTMFVDRSEFIRQTVGKDSNYRCILKEIMEDLWQLANNLTIGTEKYEVM